MFTTVVLHLCQEIGIYILLVICLFWSFVAVLDEPRFSSLHYSHRQMIRPVPTDAPPAFSSSIQLCNSVKYDASIRGQIMGESERECCFLSVEQIIFRRCLSHQWEDIRNIKEFWWQVLKTAIWLILHLGHFTECYFAISQTYSSMDFWIDGIL